MSVTEFRVKCFAVIPCSYFRVINSVKQDLQLAGSSSDSLLIGSFISSKSPLLSLLGLIFGLSIYTCHNPTQHHFLSIIILSESPFRVCPTYFLFCVHTLKLFLRQSLSSLLYLPYLTDFLYCYSSYTNSVSLLPFQSTRLPR